MNSSPFAAFTIKEKTPLAPCLESEIETSRTVPSLSSSRPIKEKNLESEIETLRLFLLKRKALSIKEKNLESEIETG